MLTHIQATSICIDTYYLCLDVFTDIQASAKSLVLVHLKQKTLNNRQGYKKLFQYETCHVGWYTKGNKKTLSAILSRQVAGEMKLKYPFSAKIFS